MEIVLSLVVFVGVYSLIFVVKSMFSRPDVKAKPIMGEAFPTVELFEMQQPQEPPAPSRPVVSRKAAAPAPKPVVVASEEKHTVEKVHGRIQLGNRSEAKKAFIYSEIFKRKY